MRQWLLPLVLALRSGFGDAYRHGLPGGFISVFDLPLLEPVDVVPSLWGPAYDRINIEPPPKPHAEVLMVVDVQTKQAWNEVFSAVNFHMLSTAAFAERKYAGVRYGVAYWWEMGMTHKYCLYGGHWLTDFQTAQKRWQDFHPEEVWRNRYDDERSRAPWYALAAAASAAGKVGWSTGNSSDVEKYIFFLTDAVAFDDQPCVACVDEAKVVADELSWDKATRYHDARDALRCPKNEKLTVADAGAILRRENVTPVFLLRNGFHIPKYQGYVDELGTGFVGVWHADRTPMKPAEEVTAFDEADTEAQILFVVDVTAANEYNIRPIVRSLLRDYYTLTPRLQAGLGVYKPNNWLQCYFFGTSLRKVYDFLVDYENSEHHSISYPPTHYRMRTPWFALAEAVEKVSETGWTSSEEFRSTKKIVFVTDAYTQLEGSLDWSLEELTEYSKVGDSMRGGRWLWCDIPVPEWRATVETFRRRFELENIEFVFHVQRASKKWYEGFAEKIGFGTVTVWNE